MAKRKTRVTKLNIDEVSLVDRGANPAAYVVLAKAAPVDDYFDDDLGVDLDVDGGDKYRITKSANEILSEALAETLESIAADDTLGMMERAEAVEKAMSEFRDCILANDNPELTDAGESVHKEAGHMAENKESVLKGLSAEQNAAVNELVSKAVGAAVETALSSVTKRLETVETENTSLKTEIAKRDRIAKAKGLIGDLPIKVEEFEAVLAKVEGTDAEKFIVDLLGKQRAAVKAGHLFTEVGKAAGVDSFADSAEGKINKAAEDIRKSNPKLTAEQAYAEALSRNPKLYEEYLNESEEN